MVQPVPGTEIGVGTILAETYEITHLIGRGGMGAVWAANHARLPGKRVAVKVLLTGITAGSEAFMRFRREAEIASRIGHPNIIEVIDFNVLPSGTPYLILEYLDGEDLAGRLRKGPIPLAQTLAIARQIGSALAAAHREHVVHRDLKPENIYLCPTDDGDRVKVLDFGISKIHGSTTVQTQESRILGTPQYMSPEQATGKNTQVDLRTDVFALGSIVYEMLCGRPAFSGDTLAEVVFKVVYEPHAPLAGLAPDVPAAVVAAVDRALDKDPAKRWPDVPSFVAALTGQKLATVDRAPGGGIRERSELQTDQNAFAATMTPPVSTPITAPIKQSGETAFAATMDSRDIPPPATSRSATVDKPASRGRLFITLAPLVVAAAAIIYVVATRGSGDKQPVAVTPAVTPAAPADAAPAPPPPPAPDAAVIAVASPPDAGAPAVVVKKQIPKPPVIVPPVEPVDEEEPTVKADLDAAAAALEAGKAKEAIRLATRSLNTRKTSRAFSIIARAYCKLGDLGNAKAQLPHMRPRDRVKVVRACKAAGIEL